MTTATYALWGRIKDIIIKGGENITPSEIEAEALNVSGLKEFRVFGFKDRLYGENLGACLTLQHGATFDENTARKHLRYDSFPLNATGKIDQRSLHVDMLKRLRKMELNDELEKGVCVLSVTIKNTSFAITPLVSIIENCAIAFRFNHKRASRIRFACEEMLTERILNAFEDVGDIAIKLYASRTSCALCSRTVGSSTTSASSARIASVLRLSRLLLLTCP